MNKFITLEKSVQGASHKSKTPPVVCQDKCMVRKIDDETYILAVADGHGSERCRFSDIGAELAVRTFCEMMEEVLENCEKTSNGDRDTFIRKIRTYDDGRIIKTIHKIWKKRIEKSFNVIKHEHDDLKDINVIDTELYGTTLLGIVMAKDFVYCIQIGDGDIAYVDSFGVKQVIEADKFLGTETYSLSNEKPWENVITFFQRRKIDESAPYLFILTTDGFSNSFLDDEQYHVACADYFKLACKYGQEEIQNNLEKWLNHTSENGSGDDITFVAAGVLDDALLGEDFEFQQSNDESETNDSLSEDVYTVPVRMGDENFEITLPKPTEINQFEDLDKTTIKDECTIISI